MFMITSLQPAGETRTPTPAWSGLGFSCSMPEAVIRFVIMIVIRFSLVLGATSAILYCRSGCMCCVIISSRLRSFRFCYRELEHSKARAAREKEVVNTWFELMIIDHKCLILFVSFPIHREHLGRFEQWLVWCLHQHSWRVHGRWQVLLTFLLCSVNRTFWMTSLIIFFGFVLKYAL